MNDQETLDFIASELENGLRRCKIPPHMEKAIRAYVNEHREPGHFLQAVLENDFIAAVCRADHENTLSLRTWALLLHNYTPSECHGSVENYENWIKE